jgi:histone H3/H4
MDAYKKQMGDNYVEDNNTSGGGISASSSSSIDGINSLIFPVARISKIAKLDPDINAISKEAIQLIVKSTELFLSKAGIESMKVASIHNRRTVYSDDIKHICQHRNEFIFLKDDIKDITKELLQQKENDKLLKALKSLKANAGNEEEGGEGDGDGDKSTVAAVGVTGNNKKEALRVAAAAGSKPLTSYFTSSSSSK